MQSTKPKPRRWLRDYVFWRDILTTLIGGLLVLVTAYLWAVFTGYIQTPGVWETVVSVTLGIAVPILSIVVALVSMLLTWKTTVRGKAGEDWFSQSLTESFRDGHSSAPSDSEPDSATDQDS